MDPLLLAGLRLLRARRWFAAHEPLEDAWRAEEDPQRRRFLQGLIHGAVCLEHLQRGNPKGAGLQRAKGRRRWEGLGAWREGVGIGAWSRALDELLERDDPGPPEGWPLPPLASILEEALAGEEAE